MIYKYSIYFGIGERLWRDEMGQVFYFQMIV